MTIPIHALETLRAKETVPHLTSLFNDDRRSNFGPNVSVAEAAKAAVERLTALP